MRRVAKGSLLRSRCRTHGLGTENAVVGRPHLPLLHVQRADAFRRREERHCKAARATSADNQRQAVAVDAGRGDCLIHWQPRRVPNSWVVRSHAAAEDCKRTGSDREGSRPPGLAG